MSTLYCWCKVDSCLHCKFRNGAWRTRAAFQDSALTFEDWIIYKDIADIGLACKQFSGFLYETA